MIARQFNRRIQKFDISSELLATGAFDPRTDEVVVPVFPSDGFWGALARWKVPLRPQELAGHAYPLCIKTGKHENENAGSSSVGGLMELSSDGIFCAV
jgi:hypothetical protein